MTRLRSAGPIVALALAVGAFPVPANAQETSPRTAITGVGVVDVAGGRILENRTVVLDGGRIRSVEADGGVPDGATLVDGRGKYLMPGIWDMHAHVRHPAAPDLLMPQLVAHGVTGIREMASGCDGEPDEGEVCVAELLEWRERVEAGELLGPRILQVSSFPLNPPWDYDLTEDQARAVVRQFHERGADLLKVYYRLPPEGLAWISDEAERLGLYTGGHIPIRMTAAEASDAGLRTLEHARDFLFDCFPGSAEFRATTRSQNPPMEVMRSMVEDHDEARCAEAFATLVENDTWYVPTHVTRRMDAFADDPDFRDDPRKRYIPAVLWEEWQEDADRMVALDPSPEGRRVMRGFYEKGLEITRRAHGAGVKIMLGTDSGDTYVFPGSGAHDELGELVKAGLTPAEALATATLRPAEFLGLEADHGAVAPGKRSDLLLLGGNPLEDIAHTRAIEAVFFGEKILDRTALDALLAEVEEAVASFGG